MAEITVTAQNFQDEVVQSKIPVLIDFWATWCGPCRMIAPTVAEIAEDYAGKLKVGKVNTDEQPVLADAFRIQSIPTLVLVKDGQVVDSTMGAVPKSVIEQMLAKNGIQL